MAHVNPMQPIADVAPFRKTFLFQRAVLRSEILFLFRLIGKHLRLVK